MRFATLATLLAGLFVFSEPNAGAATITLTETLTGVQGNLPIGSPVTATETLDTITDLFTWTITWPGLSTPFTGRTTLSAPDASHLLADLIQMLDKPDWFITVHPPADPPGVPPVATPEPSTTILLGAGLALLGLVLMQRRQRG